MTNNEELSRYMAQIEQYKEQINQLEQQYQYIQAAISDYNKAKITLNKIEETDDDTDLLIPIGGGTFVKGKAVDTKNVLSDIGAGYISEKNCDEAIKKIDERIEYLEKNQDTVSDTIKNLQQEANDITAQAQKLYEEMQNQQ